MVCKTFLSTSFRKTFSPQFCIMKKLLLIIFFSFAFIISNAQHADIKGIINDTINKQNLSNAVISILREKDSILIKFTRSDDKGNFEIKNLDSGKYILLITYPQYADYTDHILLNDFSRIDLGKLVMILKANLLKDVIVRNIVSAIRIKGDTTEFAADSFKVQPNATVEDLLKKLPGIQIDKDGNITAQGEKVKKVLVDGEEFFGDDPTLVTQNLNADMVDKVQIYDKKTDQAIFTGIDDGRKEKTINLKLKDSKKNGYFGKANASAGTDGYNDSQLMLNDFKNKNKFGFYGIVSNIGTAGLNWQDMDNYGDNPFANSDPEEGININTSDPLDSWRGTYTGQGYPIIQTAGLHYNDKWNDDKESLNANYKILQLHVNGNSATQSEYILPDTLYFNNDKQIFANKILRNRANVSYEYQLDSMSSIKISADGGDDHKITNLLDSSESRASDSSLVNNAFRRTSAIGDNRTVNSNIIFRKKFKKKGRTLSFNLRENYSNNTSTGYLYSANNFYLKNILTQDTITDQYKTNSSESILFNAKLAYTEPLSKVSSLVINYGVIINNSNASVKSYNKGADGKYSALDSLYSSDYLFNILTNKGGAAYSLYQKKFKMNFGTDVGYSSYTQQNEIDDSSLSRKFVNWYPYANASYQFSQERSFWFNYYGATVQPTIQELQPVLTNIDPLNLTLGNTALKPAFQNNLSLSFRDYKVLKQRGIYIGINYGFTENFIGNKSYVDSFGRTINQYINVNGDHSYGLHLNYDYKIKKYDLNSWLFSDINSYRNVSVVNNLLNITQSADYTVGFGFEKDKEKKYSFNFNPSITYTTSNSSIQQSLQIHYFAFDTDPSLLLYLPHKFQIRTDCDFNLKQKTPAFNNNTNVILWNAWIGRTFLRNDKLLVKVVGNDLLDQNIGFNRTVNSNFISQNTYSTIRRYFLLSVSWNFNKAGTKAPGH